MVFINVKIPKEIIIGANDKKSFLSKMTMLTADTLKVPVESVVIELDESISYTNVMIGGKQEINVLKNSLEEAFTSEAGHLTDVIKEHLGNVSTNNESANNEFNNESCDELDESQYPLENNESNESSEKDEFNELVIKASEALNEAAENIACKLSDISNKIVNIFDEFTKK